MTYLEAAHKILSKSGQPLHYKQITDMALDRGLITPTGLTPDATMGSRLYTDTKQDGSEFVRAGRGMFALAEQQPVGIDAQVKSINATTREQLRDLLHSMPPERFEELIHELLIQMGFDESTLTVTPYSNDGGIDVVGVLRAAGLTEVNAAVQAKRWKNNVTAPTVTQLRGSLQVHQQGIVITTSDFSKGAREEANAPGKTRISLINGEELLGLLFKHKVGVQERTLTVMSVDEEWWGDLIVKSEDDNTPADNVNRTAAESDAPTFRHPTSIVFLGETSPVETWKNALIKVSALMADRHPTTFTETVVALKGRKRHYFNSTPQGMTRPEKITGTDLWVETNLSAKDIVRRIDQLRAAFGYNSDDLAINY